MNYLQNYIQYAVNIFDFIEEHKSNHTLYRWFFSLFHNQFTTAEILIIYLSNLANTDMPFCRTIKWKVSNVYRLLSFLQIIRCYKISDSDLLLILKYISEKENYNCQTFGIPS